MGSDRCKVLGRTHCYDVSSSSHQAKDIHGVLLVYSSMQVILLPATPAYFFYSSTSKCFGY